MSANRFRFFGIITVIAVFFLILVGGIVRSTGAGMGCPDWPKCFGTWIPPTDISQLPSDYKVIFKVAGKEIADFDAFKTWVEYLNRLTGVLIGFFVILTMYFSFSYWKKDNTITYFAIASFILVLFEGWLGSIVVATNLKPVVITLHMILALVIVCMLIFAVARAWGSQKAIEESNESKQVSKWFLAAMLLNLLQITIGTQVREAVDTIAVQLGGNMRETWIEQLGLSFLVHRSFSIVVFGVQVYALILMKKFFSNQFEIWRFALIGLLLLEILSGIGMAYFGIPKILQPFHLFVGSLILGGQFTLWMFFNKKILLGQAQFTEAHI